MTTTTRIAAAVAALASAAIPATAADWFDMVHKTCLEVARLGADYCAAEEKRSRAEAAETKRSVDESMAKYKREQDALPAIGWYLRGCGVTSTLLFSKGRTPMDDAAYLKSVGALAYDRTTYDADGHVASYTYVTVAGVMTQYFGTLAACRAAQ